MKDVRQEIQRRLDALKEAVPDSEPERTYFRGAYVALADLLRCLPKATPPKAAKKVKRG